MQVGECVAAKGIRLNFRSVNLFLWWNMIKDLLSIRTLSIDTVDELFHLARKLKNGYQPSFAGLTSVYSFEGNSFRTRLTFLKALTHLKITGVELPNLLKTKEDKTHLAGYLDQ